MSSKSKAKATPVASSTPVTPVKVPKRSSSSKAPPAKPLPKSFITPLVVKPAPASKLLPSKAAPTSATPLKRKKQATPSSVAKATPTPAAKKRLVYTHHTSSGVSKSQQQRPMLPTLAARDIPEEFVGNHSPPKVLTLSYEIDWDLVTSIHDIKAILSTLDLRYHTESAELLKIGYLVKSIHRTP